jgi:hypothetical protein
VGKIWGRGNVGKRWVEMREKWQQKCNGHRVSFREEGGKRMGIVGKGKWGTKKVNEKM